MHASRLTHATALLLLLGAAPASTLPVDAPPPDARDTYLTLRDARRGLDLSVTVFRPTTLPDGRLPVVLLSHGAGAPRAAMGRLARAVSARGYLCLVPGHADGAAAGRHLEGGAAAWEQRVHDLSFLIDALPEVEAREPDLKGRIDATRVGVVGHALGASTAMLAAGVRPTWDGRERDLRDPRIRCTVLLSGQGPGQQGLTEASFKTLAVPALVVAGTADRGPGGPAVDATRGPYLLAPPGDKFLLVLDGANPFSLLGNVGRGTRQQRYADATAVVTATFLDAYLKDDQPARDLVVAGSVIAPYASFSTLEGK